ncbi:MAG: ATP-dependent zinc metalloprotease FtsH [Verrucomicrobiae bacterium]|nr:ATP-dependent zinc metalloprotease FtsH [Verrucomicrobiae bacterium]
MKTKRPVRLDPRWRVNIFYVVLMLALLWAWQESFSRLAVRTINYSEFKQHVAAREVVECAVKTDEIVGRVEPKDKKDAAFLFRTVRVEDPKLVEELQVAGVKFGGVRPSFLESFFVSWVLPLGLMFAVWSFLGRRFGAMGEAVLNIGKSRARLIREKQTGVTFADVAGCDEAKLELQEVVDFLKNPKRYQALGAKIPKGVLLVGPPGTGKTLLAKAIAGEADVPFFSISGSDFVEMFVGVGAARVRDLFQQGKAHAPCIIFIDELDAIGRQRGVHLGAVNDEREQTLNQLLVEMDGFEPNAGVIVLAATNRPEILDRALLRPGRFDRQVIVDAPDLDGREAILKVHTRGKPLTSDVDLRRIAAATPGFSGADLANVINEAALLAARRAAKAVTQRDLEEAVEKVVAGPQRRSRRLSEEQKRRVAYHEVGHALVAAYSEHADPVHKISIVPRGRAALGYTLQLPTEDQFLLTQSELNDRLAGLLGGRAAEETVFGEVSSGAENDLERATALARQMVGLFGMSEKVGLAHCAQKPGAFLSGGDGLLQTQRDCSEQTAREMDEEVKRLLDDAYRRAKQILSERRDQLETVARELLQRETLDGDAFRQLLGRGGGHDVA